MTEKQFEKNFKKLAAVPAELLDDGVRQVQRWERSLARARPVKLAGQYWHKLGPGLTTGAADDDPSGIATYSQAGAGFGFKLLWLAPFSFPLMALVQEMCARIGIVTGRGLAANIRRHFSRRVLFGVTSLLFAANSFNIGADLGAMAQATQLLAPEISFGVLVVVFALLILFLEIFVSYVKYAKYLKYLSLVLLAYIFSAIAVDLDWRAVLNQAVIPLIPMSREALLLICAVLGTTISPYLFFWQTSQEVEEEILAGKTTIRARAAETSPREIGNMRLDVWSGMFFSNLVMFFIIIATAATLFPNGLTTIASAAEAAEALRPFAGEWSFLLFTLGIIGTGMLAIPVLAGSSAYALAESFGWRAGLSRKLKSAHAFYGVIIVAMLLGLGMNFLGLDPIRMLIWSAVANGLIAPFVLVTIVRLSSDRKIMGSWTNHPWISHLGWAITGLMTIAALAAIGSLVW